MLGWSLAFCLLIRGCCQDAFVVEYTGGGGVGTCIGGSIAWVDTACYVANIFAKLHITMLRLILVNKFTGKFVVKNIAVSSALHL